MKYLTILSMILFLLASCQNNESKKAEATDNEATEVVTEAATEFVIYNVTIEGMTCTGCEETIEAGVTKVEGVGSVEASHTDGNASIKFEKDKVDTAAVKEAIEAAGYKVVSFKEASEGTVTE